MVARARLRSVQAVDAALCVHSKLCCFVLFSCIRTVSACREVGL